MKIGNPADTPPPSPTSGPSAAGSAAARPAEPAAAKANAAAPAAAPESSATVALSTTASSLLQGTGAANADFDAEKVARISQAIADGSFKIDAGAIADKLISNAQEVLGKVS